MLPNLIYIWLPIKYSHKYRYVHFLNSLIISIYLLIQIYLYIYNIFTYSVVCRNSSLPTGWRERIPAAQGAATKIFLIINSKKIRSPWDPSAKKNSPNSGLFLIGLGAHTNESWTGQGRVVSTESASERIEKLLGYTHSGQSSGLGVSLPQITERHSLAGCCWRLWRSDPQIPQSWWGGGGAGEDRQESRSVGFAWGKSLQVWTEGKSTPKRPALRRGGGGKNSFFFFPPPLYKSFFLLT